MHIPLATIATMFGPGRLPPTPMVTLALTRQELHLLARALEREADLARAERADHAADRLDNRAAALREAAR